jgi:gas vesicle protein
MKKSTKSLAIGTAIAAGVGYVTGLLTAPKSGKETRKDIHDTALKAKREAEKKLKKLHSDLDSLIIEGRKQAEKLKAGSKQDLTMALEVANKAKIKAREALSAVHEGGGDDKDLQKAIKEASSAVDHLKIFLKK